MTFTPTFTRLERASLKLLIKFAWGAANAIDCERARKLVISALELDDTRPVNAEKRKDALNAFLARTDPTPESEMFPIYGSREVEEK